MEYNFLIGIPTINRADLLEQALMHYRKSFPDVFKSIIDNGKQGFGKIHDTLSSATTEMNFNFGVAMSWNLLCMAGFFEKEYAVILNDDVILQYNQDEIQQYLNEHKPLLAIHGSGFCAFIIHKSVFEKVGFFDFNFSPAYFEDADYVYRCKLAGIEITKPEILRTIVTGHSSSIEKDPTLNDRFQINKQYYIQKWGGEVGAEKFTTPFNIK
jgi:hypothetical protein